MLLSRLFFYEKFRSLNNYALICRLNGEKHKKKHTMNNFLKNLGILLIVLGTAVLVLSYVCNWLDYNWPSFIGYCGRYYRPHCHEQENTRLRGIKNGPGNPQGNPGPLIFTLSVLTPLLLWG
jgi:hypothetical protein